MTLDIPVVFDQAQFVVVDKPAGISVQNETTQSGILPLLTRQLGIDKLWLVHRLDKVTSGLLILAKNADAAAQLSALFASRQIEKYYLAVSDRKPGKKQGTIRGDMIKVRDGKWMLTRGNENPAVSQFFSFAAGSGRRGFLIKPLSGKTHQIRVALKSLGSPILGDAKYAGSASDRTYLHAYGLRFSFQDSLISLTLPPTKGDAFLSPSFTEALTEMAEPHELSWPKLAPAISQRQ